MGRVTKCWSGRAAGWRLQLSRANTRRGIARASRSVRARFGRALPGWLDDAEVAAAVQHAHDVEHAVEVALLARGHRRVPQLFHEGLRVGTRRRGQAPHGRGGEHARRVARRQRLAIERIAIREGADALALKELLEAVAQRALARILAPPGIPVEDETARASPFWK